MKHIILPALVLASLAPVVGAQGPGQVSAANPSRLQALPEQDHDFVAVHEEDGQLYGFGNSYRTLFHNNDVVFQPAFGKHEPETRFLHFTMQSAGRGVTQAVSAPQRVVDGLTVTYERARVDEVYEVRGDGLKQSFVFDRIPAGNGDLIVRGQLDTNMELVRATATGIQYKAWHGTASIGEVIGFDAKGLRTKGSLHLDNGILEMRLPESFVERAVAPITLDPFIGGNANLGAGNDFDPDVAYDKTNAVFFTVWSHVLSASDADIVGQMVDADGTFVSSNVVVRTGTNWISTAPRVANIDLRDKFVVVWMDDWYAGGTTNDVRARAVKASNGSLDATFMVKAWASGSYNSNVDIGGCRGNTEDFVGIAWTNEETIEACTLRVSSTGTYTFANGGPQDIGYDQHGRNVSVSDYSPNFPYFWFVWDAFTFTDALGTNDPRSVIASLRQAGMQNALGGTNFYEVQRQSSNNCNTAGICEQWINPSIAGTDTDWVVAMERIMEPGTGLENDSIRVETIKFRDGLFSAGTQATSQAAIISPVGEVADPEVTWGNGSIVVACIGDGGTPGNDHVYVKTLKFEDCETCEGLFQWTTSGQNGAVRMASQSSGGGNNLYGNNEHVMVVTPRANASQHVRRSVFEMVDGIVNNLGGGCGDAVGRSYFNCGTRGENTAFVLHDTDPSINAWILIGPDRLDEGCGIDCTVVVNPFTAWVTLTPTNGDGDIDYAINIPNDPSLTGMTFYQQWLLNTSGNYGCGAIGGLEASDALRVTIQ